MSEKKGDKKLGRNPFDHKKTSRAKHHEPIEEPVSGIPAAEPGLLLHDKQSGSSSPIPFSASSAWLLVDLWTGALMEPYFFWARSVDIVKRTIESASPRG